MAISNVSSYSSVYENVFASKQTKTSETDGTSKTSSTSQTAEEYLSNLRQKYSNVNITVADFSSDKQLKSYMFGSSGYNNIAISSSILEKMASDPATAAKYEKVIADVPNLGEEFKSECAALGTELLACGTVIDKNGNVSYWGIGRSETENPGTVYKEKVQKQLEEKRAKNKEEEALKAKKQEEAEKQKKLQEKKVFTAESKEELLEKIRNKTSENEPSVDKKIKEAGKGEQIDLSV